MHTTDDHHSIQPLGTIKIKREPEAEGIIDDNHVVENGNGDDELINGTNDRLTYNPGDTCTSEKGIIPFEVQFGSIKNY